MSICLQIKKKNLQLRLAVFRPSDKKLSSNSFIFTYLQHNNSFDKSDADDSCAFCTLHNMSQTDEIGKDLPPAKPGVQRRIADLVEAPEPVLELYDESKKPMTPLSPSSSSCPSPPPPPPLPPPPPPPLLRMATTVAATTTSTTTLAMTGEAGTPPLARTETTQMNPSSYSGMTPPLSKCSKITPERYNQESFLLGLPVLTPNPGTEMLTLMARKRKYNQRAAAQRCEVARVHSVPGKSARVCRSARQVCAIVQICLPSKNDDLTVHLFRAQNLAKSEEPFRTRWGEVPRPNPTSFTIKTNDVKEVKMEPGERTAT